MIPPEDLLSPRRPLAPSPPRPLAPSPRRPVAASPRRFLLLIAALAATALPACGPNLVAIDNRLREQNMQQQQQISSLQDKLAQRDATARQLQAELDQRLPRVETLPDARLAVLFTVSKIEIRPQTDSWEIAPGKGLTAFRVFFRTLTDDGMNIPATGDLTIEAFELAPPPQPPTRLGTWKFSAAELKKNYYNGFGLNQFAVNCPWTQPPTSPDITFRLTFRDALTARQLEAHLDKKVTLPK